MKGILYLVLLLLDIQLLNSQCVKAGNCTKSYKYISCSDGQPLCSKNPYLTAFKAPNPICLKFYGNGPATVEIQLNNGQYQKFTTKTKFKMI